jgi:pyruvate kinase
MTDDAIKKLDKKLATLESVMQKAEKLNKDFVQKVHKSQVFSAKNLLHYLALRSHDIRELQNELHRSGLSSLASSESHIRSQLQAIRQRLGAKISEKNVEKWTLERSLISIKEKTNALFGPKIDEDLPSIMVTFDTSFADNAELIKKLLNHGMNVARINCAHDDETVWLKMIENLKKISLETGKSCKIYMDLAGPKIRTEILQDGKHKKKAKKREIDKVKISEGQVIWLAYNAKECNKNDIIISPGEENVISGLKVGDRVYMDDGIIKGIITKTEKNRAELKITRISTEKKRIKKEKGMNFPDSELNIPSLTSYDVSCLPFICSHADMVGYSFVRKPSDLQLLKSKVEEINARMPALIIKVETPESVRNLPEILFEGMKNEHLGVMIARGDLAVEIGFERMGEIQEEILWICEAAHVPVIWATQVLESLNKSGLATRSEITDAGHAAMAECIMINKGSFTVEVMRSLGNILKRTAQHRNKKRFIFRPLNIAKDFFTEKNTETST